MCRYCATWSDDRLRPSGRSVPDEQSRKTSLFILQKGDVLFQLTLAYCARFLPRHGDPIAQQMVTLSETVRQHIQRGMEAGMASVEVQAGLLDEARTTSRMLQEQYETLYRKEKSAAWDFASPDYDTALSYCREHPAPEDYRTCYKEWSAGEMSTMGITLCHMIDRMLFAYVRKMGGSVEG